VYFGADAVEVPLDYVPPAPNQDHILWNDRQYQDANDSRFASRSQHREYMKINGLTVADDFKGYWQQKANERADYYTTGGDHSARRQALIDAIRHQKEK
jgi:hypothetical protein